MPGRVFWQDLVANAILFIATDKLFGRKNKAPIGDTNIKSYTVAYTLSYFHFLTNNRLNLDNIWDKQMIGEDLQTELKKGLKFVYDFLNSLDVALISEAAKAEKTWSKLKERTDHPMNMEVVNNYLFSEEEYLARFKPEQGSIDEIKRYEKSSKNHFTWS
jgi:hypothetical protein